MNFTTSFDPQIVGRNGFTTLPLVTIGEIIPDTTGALNSSTAGDYQPVGILDGMGAIRFDDDTVRAFVNHELLDFEGIPYDVFDESGNPFTIVGGRISYFDINVNTFEVEDSGIAYNTIIDANGNVANNTDVFGFVLAEPGNPDGGLRQVEGFARFCSGGLNEAEQFGPGRGLADDIYFAGEEVGGFFNNIGGSNWGLDVATGTIYQLPFLGRGSWENTSEIDTGTTTHVAFILADDQSPFDFDGDGENESPPFYLYVGEKNSDSEDFLERNGLTGGALYVWVPDANLDEDGSNDILSALEFRNAGTTANGAWVQIENGPQPENASDDGSTGFDQFGFPTQANLISQAEAVGAFSISRPEDVATNPNNPSEIVQAVTGVDNGFIDPETGNGADSFGALYTLDTDFSNLTTTGELTGVATVIYDGDEDPNRSLRSPDNLDWADDGFIYVQEDEAEEDTLGPTINSPDGPEFLFGQGAANPNEASIVRIDPNATSEEAAVGANVVTIATVDRSQILDPTIPDPTTAVDEDFERTEDGVFGPGEVQVVTPGGDTVILDAGEWETSGIVDVSNLFDADPGEIFLFNVQAHGLADQDDVNLEQGDQSALTDDNLSEGGQLLLLFSPTDTDTATGTDGDDLILLQGAGDVSEEEFDGVNDVVFTGGGEDEVDLELGANALTGGNRINTGGNDDVIFVGRRDRVSGSTGNDLFDATGSLGGNRMSGGAGDDTFALGGDGDRALGGDGDDTFEVLFSATDNLIAGGAGADDFFFLPNGETPASDLGNQILDFEAGTDIVSFGIGVEAADVFVGADGGNSSLSIFGFEVAAFSGVLQADLQLAVDSAFA